MNIIWHQLKKDARRVRVLLGLWIFIAVLRFALVSANVNPSDQVWQTVLSLLSMLTLGLGAVLVLVLVPLVIQQEPLVGTTAFWLTRPISRSTLLKEKALFLAGLIILPLLIQTIVLLANGATGRDAILAAPEFVLGQANWFLTVAALAVLTPSFGRFMIACAIFFVLSYLFLFLFQVTRLFGGIDAFVGTLPSLTSSRQTVSELVMIAFGTAVVLFQYLGRRRALATVMAIAGLLLSNVAAIYWPWDFLKPAPSYLPNDGFDSASVGIKLAATPSANDQVSLRGGEPNKQLTGVFDLSGAPHGYRIRATHFDATLQTASGDQIPVLPVPDNQMFNSNSPDADALREALSGIVIANPAQTGGYSSWPMFAVTGATYQRYADMPAELSAQVHLEASKYVVTAELPLQQGAHYVHGSDRETVTQVLHQADGLDLVLQVQEVRLRFGLHADQDESNSMFSREGGVLYVLVNRKRNQALVEKENESGNFNVFPSQEVLTHQPRRISFGPEQQNRSSDWLLPTLDEAWLRDATLVRLQLVPVAAFTKPFVIPGFKLNGRFSLAPHHGQTVNVADLDDLAKINLPAHATRTQVHDYMAAILLASQGMSGRYDEHDPQIEMFDRVGAQNVDLLLEAARDRHDYYLNHSIDDLVQPDQKALVLADLPSNPDLIDTVLDHHWEGDARDVLLTGLVVNTAETRRMQGGDLFSYLPQGWLKALTNLKDPATYGPLRHYFVSHPSEATFRLLAALPGFDAAGALDESWQHSQTGTADWRGWQLLPLAAEAGKSDVPAVLIKYLTQTREPYARQRAQKVAQKYTPAVGNNADELAAWLKANQANLVFDPNAKKFVLKTSQPPPPIPVPTPSPATDTAPNVALPSGPPGK